MADEPLPEPLPLRDVVRAALCVVPGLMLAGSPVVFVLGLEYLPRHGDGTGVIGGALLLAAGDVVLAVTLLVVLLSGGRRAGG